MSAVVGGYILSTFSEGSDSVSETAMLLVAGSAARFDDRAEHVPRLHIHVHQFGGDESVNGLVTDKCERNARGGPCSGALVVFAFAFDW